LRARIPRSVTPSTQPSLPPSCAKLSFSLIVRDQRLDVTVGHDGHVVTARPDNDVVIEIAPGGREPVALEPGGAVRW
jgi:trehalose/maltose hydrolase-like predicted phosphorylase